MDSDNFKNFQISSTINLEDSDLLDDEWLYTSESFNRTDEFRKKMKNEDESRNSVLEWLATDDDNFEIKNNNSKNFKVHNEIKNNNNDINFEDIHNKIKDDDSISFEDIQNQKSKKYSIEILNDDIKKINKDSIFDDDLDIVNLDSKFMSNFTLVSQDDFEDTEIEESIVKNNKNSELQHCDSPKTEINLLDSNKLGNNETNNVDDNDSDSNMTIINTTNKNKVDSILEDDKKTEIINIENGNKENEINTSEFNDVKATLLRKNELAKRRFLAKVEQAKKTLENLKPLKDSLTTSENSLNSKTNFIEKKENEEQEEKSKNKKELQRRSYYYYADTGSDEEKEEEKKDLSSKIEHMDDHYSSSYSYFNSYGVDSSFVSNNHFNENNLNTSSSFLPPTHYTNINRLSEEFEDYPRLPPAPSAEAPVNTNFYSMDHANFENHYCSQSDIDSESTSSLYDEYHATHFANINPSHNFMGSYPASPKLHSFKSTTNANSSIISKSQSMKIKTAIPSSQRRKSSASFIPQSPTVKPTTSFIPQSPSVKPTTSFIPQSPSIKSTTTFIPKSPSVKSTTTSISKSPTSLISSNKSNASFISKPSASKSNNSHISTIGKYSSSISSISSPSSLHKQKSHIIAPKTEYSSQSFSKSYESHDPITPTFSIKDLINNKNPQTLRHSGSVNTVSDLPSPSTSRRSSLEQSIQPINYLNKLNSIQRNRSFSTSTSSTPKYSSGRRTPNGRIGNNYSESTTFTTSSSKLYSRYKTPSPSPTSSKIGIRSSSPTDSKLSSSYNSNSSLSSTKTSDIPTSSRMFSNGETYTGRLSKTPTPSSYSKSRIPSPSPYTKRSITPY